MQPNRTWKDIVTEALKELGGEAHLKEITEIVRKDPKSVTNNRVEEKVRQVVRDFKLFQSIKEGSGIYRLLQPSPLAAVTTTLSTKNTTDEIQGKLLYIGRVNDYQTFAPAADCTMRQFGGKSLDNLVTMRDSLESVVRAKNEERKVMAQIDVIWLEERDGEMLPVCAFEVENSTQVLTGLHRLGRIPRLFGTKLFIVGENESKKAKYDQYLSSPDFKPNADRFRFHYFEEVRALFEQAEIYNRVRNENEQAFREWGLI